MITFRLPSEASIISYLKTQAAFNCTYDAHFQTKNDVIIPKYDNDFIKIKIGKGAADFVKAKRAIQNWQMFPRTWTRILPVGAPIKEGTVIAMNAHFAGVWWRNACKIRYVIDEPDRYGFAYGTLPGHVESGEELFLISRDHIGNTYYEIKAFSKPRHWMAKVGYPLVRLLQARFRRDSAQQMQEIIKNQAKDVV